MNTTRWSLMAMLVVLGGCGREATLEAVTPAVARSGETLELRGSGLGTRAGRVRFDEAEAQVISWSADLVRVEVPRQTHPEVTLWVTPQGGQALSLPFTIYDAMANPDGSAGAAGTFVSLTFDDSTADQLAVVPTLDQTGLRATFYVNSTRLGSSSPELPAYMRLEDVLALQAAGHEIGGHSKHHLDLTLLEPDEAVRQICGDRERLRALGLKAQNFAWPFGHQNAELRQVAQGCGYASARSINHEGAPWPLVLPAPNPFAVPTATAVSSTTTLAKLQQLVLNGEAAGGGAWVVLIFHRVCANGCSGTAIDPALFDQFAKWLAARATSGTVTRTVRQMVGDGTEPTLHPVEAPARVGGNLLSNPSLERFSGNTLNPQCWMLADTGHQVSFWSKQTPGHDGAWAVQLRAGEPLTSNRRMKTMMDDGGCAPLVVMGGRYEFSVWYQSDVALRFNSFLRDPNGFWAPWGLGPLVPASPGGWAKATWVLPFIPPQGRALGLAVRLHEGDGHMMLDDFSLTQLP